MYDQAPVSDRDGEGYFSLRHSVQIGSGSHPSHHPMGNSGISPITSVQ